VESYSPTVANCYVIWLRPTAGTFLQSLKRNERNVIYIVHSCTLMRMIESSKLLSVPLPVHVLLEKMRECYSRFNWHRERHSCLLEFYRYRYLFLESSVHQKLMLFVVLVWTLYFQRNELQFTMK
jgi:hypothetical protein